MKTRTQITIGTVLGVGLWSVLVIALTGCTTALKSDKIISIKQRWFGLNIGESATTQTPQVQFGWGSTVWQMIPTSTNGPVNAPRYFDTFQMETSGWNPFAQNIVENTGTGDVMISTNATGQAIIPKSVQKPVPPTQ